MTGMYMLWLFAGGCLAGISLLIVSRTSEILEINARREREQCPLSNGAESNLAFQFYYDDLEWRFAEVFR